MKETLHECVESALQVAQARKYRPLPLASSKAVRAIYAAQLPGILTEGQPDDLSFFSPHGLLLATSFERVVIGDHGAYIEFMPDHVVMCHIEPKGSRTPTRAVKYIWWKPIDGSDVRLYEQRDSVGYADYKIGRWYVAPSDVVIV